MKQVLPFLCYKGRNQERFKTLLRITEHGEIVLLSHVVSLQSSGPEPHMLCLLVY